MSNLFKNLQIIHDYENKYPYLEMARVGITENNLDIFIRTDDPGKIPHFHIVDINKKDNKVNETCIQITKAEYFLHGGKQMTLNSSQRKELVEFLASKPRNKRFKTNWEYLVSMWNDNNSDVEIDESIEMPDYKELK